MPRSSIPEEPSRQRSRLITNASINTLDNCRVKAVFRFLYFACLDYYAQSIATTPPSKPEHRKLLPTDHVGSNRQLDSYLIDINFPENSSTPVPLQSPSPMLTTKTKAMTAARLKYVRIIVGRNEVWEVDRVGPEERASYWWTKPELKQIRNDYKEEVMMDGVRSLVKTRIEQEHDDRCHDTDFIDDTVDEIMNRPPHLIAAYLEAPPPPPKSKTGDYASVPTAERKKKHQHVADDVSASSSSSSSDEDQDSQDLDREDNAERNDDDYDDDAFHRKKRDEPDDFVSDDDIYSMFGLGHEEKKEEALQSKEAKQKASKNGRKKDIETRKQPKRSYSKTTRRPFHKDKATATTANAKTLSSKDEPPSPSEVSGAGAANPQSPDSGSENATPKKADARSPPTITIDTATKLSAETAAALKSKFKQAVWTVLATERLVRLGTPQAPRRTTSALIEKYLPSDVEDEDFICEPGLTGQNVGEQIESKKPAKEEKVQDEEDGRADCPICLGLVEPSQQRKITLLRRMLCRKCYRTHYTSRKSEDLDGESSMKEEGAVVYTENSSESLESKKDAQKALSPPKKKSARLDTSRKIHTRSISPKQQGSAKSISHATSPKLNEECSSVDKNQNETLNESVVLPDEARHRSPTRPRQVEDPYIPLLFQVDAALEEMEDMSVLLAAESHENGPDFKPMHLDDASCGHIDLSHEPVSPSTSSTSKRRRKSKSLRSHGSSSKLSTKRSERGASKRSGTLSDDAASTASKDRKRRSSRSLGSNSNSSNRSLGSSIGSLDSHAKGKSTLSDKKKSSNSSSITRRGRRSSSRKPLARRSTKKPSSTRSIESRTLGGKGPKTDDALESTYQTTQKERVKRRTASRSGDGNQTKMQHDSKDTDRGRRKKEELKERVAKRREKKRAAEKAQAANDDDAEEPADKTFAGSSTTGLAQRSHSQSTKEQAGLLASFLRGEEGIADFCGDEDENTIQSAPL